MALNLAAPPPYPNAQPPQFPGAQQPPYSQQPPYPQQPGQPYLPNYQQPGWNVPPPYPQSPPYEQQPPPYGQPPGWGNANQYWQQDVYGGPGAHPVKNRSRTLLISILAIVLVLVAGGVIFAVKGNLLSPPELPVVTTFTSDPSAITAGQVTTLSWDVSGATSVTIDQGIGTVPSKGTKVLTPDETTTYTLTATNKGGSETAASTVTIKEASAPVINSFEANPETIGASGSSTLSWIISGATSASITPGVGDVSPNGITTVSPSTTTTYTITAANDTGSVTATATVTIAGGGKPFVKTFTADHLTVAIGQACILKWSVEGATAVMMDHGFGPVGLSGTRVVYPEATDTYVLTAINGEGETIAELTIEVE